MLKILKEKHFTDTSALHEGLGPNKHLDVLVPCPVLPLLLTTKNSTILHIAKTQSCDENEN